MRFNTKAFRERHGLTQKQLAEMIPVALRTVERWEQSSEKMFDPSPLAVQRLRAIEKELDDKKDDGRSHSAPESTPHESPRRVRRDTSVSPFSRGTVLPSAR